MFMCKFAVVASDCLAIVLGFAIAAPLFLVMATPFTEGL